MSLIRRLAKLIWGEEVDRTLRPVLAISLAAAIAGSTGWSFMGIWAIERLGASSSALGFAFLFGAVLAATSGYLGGHLSDHFGRRRLILVGEGAMVVYPLALILVGDRTVLGLVALAFAGAFGALGGSVAQAMVADLVPPEKHQQAYASVRVAQNLGVTLGPVVGGVLLLLGGWPTLFVGVASLSVVAFVLAWRFLPHRGAYSPDGPPERGSLGVIVRDRAFLLFMGSAVFAWLVYVAFEVVLPVSLVDTHGLEPAVWGFLVVINPLMVTLFQLRVTRSVERVPAAPKLVVAMLLMGLPFLLLSVTAALPVVALVIFVFVAGEMLWVPTSQAIVAGLAPEDVRGAYMGAFGSTGAVGFALAPFFGLQIREFSGDGAMWAFFAVVAVIGAVLGALACEGARRRGRVIPSAVLET